MRSRFIPEQEQLMTPLGDGEEERAQNGAEIQPGRDRHANDDGAAGRAEDEANRHCQHVNDDDVFEHVGIAQDAGAVGQEEQAETPVEQDAQTEAGEAEKDRRNYRDARPQRSGRQRAQPFAWMESVGVQVAEIVDEVFRRGQEREGKEGEARPSQERQPGLRLARQPGLPYGKDRGPVRRCRS